MATSRSDKQRVKGIARRTNKPQYLISRVEKVRNRLLLYIR
jgi:hypothetical protein